MPYMRNWALHFTWKSTRRQCKTEAFLSGIIYFQEGRFDFKENSYILYVIYEVGF